ncbi:hypothetical protein HDU96_000842, partial [Phlyctochytrium bullatum]
MPPSSIKIKFKLARESSSAIPAPADVEGCKKKRKRKAELKDDDSSRTAWGETAECDAKKRSKKHPKAVPPSNEEIETTAKKDSKPSSSLGKRKHRDEDDDDEDRGGSSATGMGTNRHPHGLLLIALLACTALGPLAVLSHQAEHPQPIIFQGEKFEASEPLPPMSTDDDTRIDDDASTLVDDAAEASAAPRIAIIGAGAAGSSAAYFLSQTTFAGTKPNVTVYEASERVGGRAMVFNVPPVFPGDEPVEVEVGASIFVNINKNIHDFARSHNLTFTTDAQASKPDDATTTAAPVEPNSPLGIFDGEKFVFSASPVAWRAVAGAVWRWGPLSTTRSRKMALDAGNAFGKNYPLAEKGELGFVDVEGLLEALGLKEAAMAPSWEYFKNKGIGDLYLKEFVEAATRVNYGQNLDLNALATLVCLVAAFVDTEAIAGGNQLVFSTMLKESRAKALLGTPVVSVSRKGSGRGSYVVKDVSGIERVFDSVILAVPGNSQLEKIQFESLPRPRQIPFVKLHVTFVTGILDPTYFGLNPADPLPSTILTCRPDDPSLPDPPFNSVSVKTVLRDGITTVTKIFSRDGTGPDEALLKRMYRSIKRVDRFFWESYPVLNPTERGLPSFELDKVEGGRAGGFYHVNALEAAVSTMESETVASMNVVQLMKRRWEGVSPAGADELKVKAQVCCWGGGTCFLAAE